MSILSKLQEGASFLGKSKAIASAGSVIIIASAFAVGIYVTTHSKVKDGPIEQAAESVLRSQGIEYDFTPE